MKKLIMITGIAVFSVCSFQRASFFNIGHQRYSSEKIPAGKTRASWYQEHLKNSEKSLRDAIVARLKITPAEFHESTMKAVQSVAQTEQEIKKHAQDIRGTWIKNDSARKIYRANGSLWQRFRHLFQEHYPFEITDQDLVRVRKTAQDFGYTGEIVTLHPEHIQEEAFSGLDTPMEGAAAYASLITIRPNFFLYPHVDQSFILRHEISHIQHQDIVFERAIKEYVRRFVSKDLSGWNYQALQDKGLTLSDTDHAYDLLEKVWGRFHEYRADLEAMIAMKHAQDYQKSIQHKAQHDGYALDWDYPSPYQKMADVAYMQDFHDGLRNDAATSSTR